MARTCRYCQPFHLINQYQIKAKLEKGMDKNNLKTFFNNKTDTATGLGKIKGNQMTVATHKFKKVEGGVEFRNDQSDH